MEPDRLKSSAALDAEPDEVGLVYSDLRVVDRRRGPTGDIFPPAVGRTARGRSPVADHRAPDDRMPSVMFRRAVLDRVGPWDESLVADDFDFLLRVAAAGFEFRYVPGIILNYRQVGASLTSSRRGASGRGSHPGSAEVDGSRRQSTDRAISRTNGWTRRGTTRYGLRPEGDSSASPTGRSPDMVPEDPPGSRRESPASSAWLLSLSRFRSVSPATM